MDRLKRGGWGVPEGLPLSPLCGGHAFGEFYRQHVRYEIGARVESTMLRDAYARWAVARGSPSISFQAMRAMMSGLGHRHFYSSRAHYLDAALDQTEAALEAGHDPAELQKALARIDRVSADLLSLRRSIARLLPPAPAPRENHELQL